MTLGALIGSLPPEDAAWSAPHAGDLFDRVVTAVAYDSRQIIPGAVFVAVSGHRLDGVDFARQAIERGAVAVVAERAAPWPVGVPWLVVPDSRRAMAVLADRFHGRPSASMTVVGITGTNGKTTTAYLVAAMLESAGLRTGMIGTIVYRTGRDERDAGRTTPESPDVQRMLADMVRSGCRASVMEVSSHALALRRVDQVRFRAALFTNLTRDHLDFHGDMEAYFAAKRRLFEMLPADGVGVINIDDPRGPALTGLRQAVTYALDRPADVRPRALALSLDGIVLDAITPRGPVSARSKLVGRPNAYNLLASMAAGVALDLPADAIERGLAGVAGVPGRFEIVSDRGDDVTVVVDYAHTDDALRNLIETARPLASRRLITVFGCGGDRDRTKRPLMGAVAARLSDLVVVTSDNPRSEDPAAIIEEIKLGIVPPTERAKPTDVGRNGVRPPAKTPPWIAVVDRREAIEHAVRIANPGDVVIIAGKGHERTQVIGERALPFDDGQVAREALSRRRGGSNASAGGRQEGAR